MRKENIINKKPLGKEMKEKQQKMVPQKEIINRGKEKMIKTMKKIKKIQNKVLEKKKLLLEI